MAAVSGSSFAREASLGIITTLSKELVQLDKTDVAINELAKCILRTNLPPQPTFIHFKHQATEINVAISETGKLLGYAYNNAYSNAEFRLEVSKSLPEQSYVYYDWSCPPVEEKNVFSRMHSLAESAGEGIGAVISAPITLSIATIRSCAKKIIWNVADQFVPASVSNDDVLRVMARLMAAPVLGIACGVGVEALAQHLKV